MLRKLSRIFVNQPPIVILGVSWLFVLLIGLADHLSGADFAFDIFYLVPIVLATWHASSSAGFATAVFASIVWEFIDQLTGQHTSQWGFEVWNTFVELGYFALVVALFTELKIQRKQLENLSTQDALTGIANRRGFVQAAQHQLVWCQRHASLLTAVFIDVDNFKTVNDRQGHLAGDAVLVKVAFVLQCNLRAIDSVARFGGDEFVILLAETSTEEAQQVVKRLRTLLLEAMAQENWPITFSIGVVTFLKPPATLDDLLKKVDTAMYTVKLNGKNDIAFVQE